MHAGLLDVLHHSTDQHLAGVVADGVDVDLGRVLQEAVDQHRTLSRQATLAAERPEPGQLRHCPCQMIAVVDDLHGPATEDVARADQHRKPDPLDDGQRLLEIGSGAAGRLRNAQRMAQRTPLLAILGEVDRAGDVPAISSCGSTPDSFNGVWPPNETITRGAVPPLASVSAAITLSTSSRVSGSKYRRSLVS